MKTELRWINGPWDGKITVVPRPRGGEWLEDEIRDWRSAGVDAVVSLLTDGEVQDLELSDEERFAKSEGMDYFTFPIVDRSVPASRSSVLDLVKDLNGLLSRGKDILIHCRGGLGRAPLIAACLLANVGVHPEMAFRSIGAARGTSVPETAEQRQWVADFAETLTPASPVLSFES
jgi:protein-tyrosine phosphatase